MDPNNLPPHQQPTPQPVQSPQPPQASQTVPQQPPQPAPQPAATLAGAAPGPAQAVGESDKSYLATYLFAQFLGYFGVDRFYTGNIGLGIVKLLTFGGCGLWAFIDVILILAGSRKDSQGRPLAGRHEHLRLSLILFGILTILGVIGSIVYQATLLKNPGLVRPIVTTSPTPMSDFGNDNETLDTSQ